MVSILGAFGVDAAAQGWHGFVTGGAGWIDYGPGIRDAIGQVSTGALIAVWSERVSVGGQADLLISNGYVSARGGGLAELDPIGGGNVRPFVDGGYFGGEGGGLWIVGGGLDVMISGRFGIRAFVQDGIRVSRVTGPFGGMSRTVHEPALQIGLAWR